ncbi:1751_t:CDS:2 [Dentiscutata erythropus]|uniref:1751_t:CDS:1 n=1 Tax=Dentiscutata erythropus TaxID=1348616 RepID=A0A9N9NDI8_9GLOM|nr:1751_t:CDS:2 [Dentiscutata erythropus]
MSATSNQLQQLQKYIIEKNISSYDYIRFRNVEFIKSERFTRVYHAVFKNKTIVILKSFENNDLIINEIINENVNGGTLKSYLHENSQHLSWNDMIKFSLQIASAVRYLHAKGIFNLGLRSDDIFIHNKNIKLADYGLSNRLKGQTIKYQHLRFYKKSDVYNVGFLMQEICNNILFTENIVGPIEKYIKIYEA